jgi:hypothetical protein
MRRFPAGSILQIEPKYFGAISMIAPAGICGELLEEKGNQYFQPFYFS